MLLAVVGLGGLTTSCEDMLTPDLERYATEFSGKDTVNFYLGIVRNVQDMVEQNVLLGELRGDLIAPTEYASDSINDIINFTNLEDGQNALLNRAAYYKVINQCNFYLAKADSMAMKNNNYYMRREMAQVMLVRAWTYMQLVQNYGRVPFITVPVDNSQTGWETNPAEGWVDMDNLLENLESKAGLKQAYLYSETLGYPNYGTFQTGATSFAHKAFIFNADLVYGDLYLLRGSSKQDYEQAAKHYHKYLEEESGTVVNDIASVIQRDRDKEDAYVVWATGWISNFNSSSGTTGADEVRTAIPSAANSFFGKMLTRIPQVYGFDATSSNKTTTSVNSNNEEVSSTSGSITIQANYRNRQVEPSVAYTSLNENQLVVYNEYSTGSGANSKQIDVKYVNAGDARADASAPYLETEKGRLRFIQKFSSSGSFLGSLSQNTGFGFRYGVSLYRTRQIYLRYAEAINRAGYPRHAFAVLRDGLWSENIPQWATNPKPEKTDTIFVGEDKNDIDTLKVYTLPYVESQREDDAKSITYSEVYRQKQAENPWLDFRTFTSSKRNYGIHVAGCNRFTDMDSLWVYEKVVDQRIKDEAARRGQTSNGLVNGESTEIPMEQSTSAREVNHADGTKTIDRYVVQIYYTDGVYEPTAEEIAAVETIIADELALEMAFEGTRYYDLMRIARHRNNVGEDGSAWMAWLISRRGESLKPYENPLQKGALFDFLSNEKNWYLPAPKNN